MALTKFKFLVLGNPGAGKTELGLRLITALGTSGSSTVYSNVFSANLKNPVIDSGDFFLSKNRCVGMLWDYSGQRINIEEIGPELSDCDGGIIYVCDSTRNDTGIIRNLDKLIADEYKRIGLPMPPKSIYVSKCMTPESNVIIDEVITSNYDSIKNYNSLSSDLNSMLFVGDSIGTDKIKPQPYIYLIRTFDKELSAALDVDITSPMTLCILLKRAKDKRLSRTLEKPIVDELREYGVI